MEALDQLLRSLLVVQRTPTPTPTLSLEGCGVSGCRSPYFLLLQYGLDLKQRIAAADHHSSLNRNQSNHHNKSNSNDDDVLVYSLAGLATPQQCAIHQLQSYTKVMTYLKEQTMTLQQQYPNIHIVSIECLGPSSWTANHKNLHTTATNNTTTTIIDFYSDPCGWDQDSTENRQNEYYWKGEIKRLSHVWKTLRHAVLSIPQRQQPHGDVSNQVSVLMVWDSLTPLLLVHGVKKTLALLQRIKTSLTINENNNVNVQLMIYPILQETLSDHSNAQLEDISDAVITTTTDKHNTILYRPTSITQHLTNPNARLNTRGGMTKFSKLILSTANPPPTIHHHSHTQHTTTNPTHQYNHNNSTTTTTTTTTTISIQKNKKYTSSRKSSLQLSHETKTAATTTTTMLPSSVLHSTPPQEQNKKLPRIYMQDNDIEFDDLDDEDVDDDLDI